MKKVYMIAGEASGDALGAGLMKELKSRHGENISFAGIGGPRMEAEGMSSLFPMHELSYMGFAEILPHMLRLMVRVKEACEDAINSHADVFVTIDSPGFNNRVVEWLRKCYGDKITCVHYVAPTVWAYKPERAEKTAVLYDHLLTLLPFEPKYFEAYGLKSSFIGHPAVDDLYECFQTPREHNMHDNHLHVSLFPGSRKGEVKRMLPVFKEALNLLHRHYPTLHVTVHSTPYIAQFIDMNGLVASHTIITSDEDHHLALRRAHVALSKTGTVTLEIAKYGVPMVAAYKVSKLTEWLLRKYLTIPYVNLVNILSRKQVIQERLQDDCNAEKLATELKKLVMRPETARKQNRACFAALKQLHRPDDKTAHSNAADVIDDYLLKRS